MIKNILSILCLLLLSLSSPAQILKTVSYKPNAAKGEDATLNNSQGCVWPGRTAANELLNFGDDAHLPYMVWRFDSLGCTGVSPSYSFSLIRFADMDTIPRTRTTVLFAELRLFGIHPDGWYGFNYFPGSPKPLINKGWASMVTSAWSENTVTWNTQPTITPLHRASIAQSTSQFNFNTIVDVTAIVDSMLKSTNYGFLLTMQNDTAFRSAIFASSDYTIDTTLWPQLNITYVDSGCVQAGFTAAKAGCKVFQFTDASVSVPGIGLGSWLWDFGDGKTSTDTNPRDTFAAAGRYRVRLRVTDVSGCTDTISQEIEVTEAMTDWVTSDTGVCNTGGTITVQLHAKPGALFYSWNPAAAFDLPGTSDPTATITGTEAFYLLVVDADGCTIQDTVMVHLNDPLAINLYPKDTNGCMGTQIQLNVSGAGKCLWTPAIGLSSDTSTHPVLTVPGTIRYRVSGVDVNGCSSADSVFITQLPTPILTVSADYSSIDCAHNYVQLHARGAAQFNWEPARYCSDSRNADPKVSPPESTVFSVTGLNENGCSSKDTISVHYSGRTVVVVPSAFTPNGDARNDVLQPIIQCDFIMQDFAIYDRWGKEVYHTYDTGEGWDGTLNGTKCSSGTYYYMLRGRDHFNKDVLLKGDITLVR